MTDTQIVIVLAAGVSTVIILVCLALIVIVRLRRTVKSQSEALDSLLSGLRADQSGKKPGE